MVIYKYNYKLPEHKSLDNSDYCYRIKASGEFSIAMPEGAIVLGVQEFRNELILWAMIDPKLPSVNRRFFYVGTGQHIPLSYVGHLSYISSLSLLGGEAIFHFFQLDNAVPIE